MHKASIQSEMVSSVVTSGVVSEAKVNSLRVHDRLFEKSKSPTIMRDIQPSPQMRYSERKILQARKDMECSFKP